MIRGGDRGAVNVHGARRRDRAQAWVQGLDEEGVGGACGGCRELTRALLELLGQPRRRPAMRCSRWTVEKEHGLARDERDAAWPGEDVASGAHAEKKEEEKKMGLY